MFGHSAFQLGLCKWNNFCKEIRLFHLYLHFLGVGWGGIWSFFWRGLLRDLRKAGFSWSQSNVKHCPACPISLLDLGSLWQWACSSDFGLSWPHLGSPYSFLNNPQLIQSVLSIKSQLSKAIVFSTPDKFPLKIHSYSQIDLDRFWCPFGELFFF